MNQRQFLLFIFPWWLSTLWLPAEASATKVTERFSFGGFVSQERFKDTVAGSDSNDFAILSGRAYLRVQDWGESKWEFVSDLRDKNDFFDKLDAERLQLTPRNDFQIRQLSVRRPNPNGFWSPQVGRFAVPEAGAVFVDGAQVENHWSHSLKTSLFAGLNPKQEAQSYLQFDTHASVYGFNLTYQDHSAAWNKNLYVSNALVQKTFDSSVDRTYFFNNLNYQWNRDSRVISLLYLDFVPRSYMQSANVIWQQALTSNLASQLEGLSIDAIEYTRRQGVLEVLPSSPYKQASGELAWRPDALGKTYISYLAGKRDIDQLTKTEADLGWSRSNVFSPNWDLHAMVGVGKNFTSDDIIARAGTGYFSRSWESTLDVDFSAQTYTDKTLHPLIAEWTLSHYHSRSVYTTISLERAADEEKTILSAFFKIGIQMGNHEVPPIRDGAPPRGAL